MEKEKLDIVSLIERNPITRFNNLSNSVSNDKLINKLKENFNDDEQQLFLGSFYCYLNYDKELDFVIELNNIWKWLGYGRIEECKRVLIKHFTKDIDYKIEKAAPQVGGAGSETNISTSKKNLGGAGLNKERILLNIKTFRKLCLKSSTKKADEIHDYFIKLEELLQEVIMEEANELQFQLINKEKQIEEKNKLLKELENKPETEGFQSRESGEVYYWTFKNRNSDIPGYITVPRNIPELNKLKIENKNTSKYNGVSYDSKRKFYVVSIKMAGKTYNLGSNESEEECAKLYNQQALYFNNQFNTNYILNDIPGYTTTPKDIRTELQEIKKNNKTSMYYGVSITKAEKWVCSYMLNRKKVHIGTFNTELEAAEAYNNTVTILNKNGCNYPVNKI